jgi:hypothetical protein
MRRTGLTLTLLLALCGLAGAYPPTPPGPVAVEANKIVRLTADTGTPEDLVFWGVDKEELIDAEELPGGRLYFSAPPGVYRVKCTVVPVKDGKISGAQKSSRYVVTVGKPEPPPKVMTGLRVEPPSLTLAAGGTARLRAVAVYDDGSTADPPAPASWSWGNAAVATADPSGLVTAAGPGETPVTAKQGGFAGSATVTVTGTPPTPAPIDGKGLHVLVVYESADLPKMPAAQQGAIYGASVRAYLNATCPPGPDGKQREWWMIDADTDVSQLPKKWQDAVKRAKGTSGFKTPWVLVSNPDKGGGYEGPLPESADKFLELLKKYGG